MSTFVESLKRLFLNGMIDDDKLLYLKSNNKITDNEYMYIIGEP